MTTETLNRKPIFDALRRLLGRGFKSSEVETLDDAIDDALSGRLKPDAPSVAEGDEVPMRVSDRGIALIHSFETCAKRRPDGRFDAYPDPGSRDGNPWTIGWGSTGADHFNGGKIRRGTIWTQAQCDERSERDMAKFSERVVKALGDALPNTSQAQFDALVSFDYNTGAIFKSTLGRKHVAGDHEGAAREFKCWNKNDGRVLRGLVRRREDEEKLYRSGM